MQTFLAILLIIAVIATAVALVRGLIAFLRTTEADLNAPGDGPTPSQLKQNKMMTQRILFQGAAIMVIILLLAVSRG